MSGSMLTGREGILSRTVRFGKYLFNNICFQECVPTYQFCHITIKTDPKSGLDLGSWKDISPTFFL